MGGLDSESGSEPDFFFAVPIKPKLYALALLAGAALIVPLLEVIFTGHSEPMSKFGIAEALVALTAIYWWYHVDKGEREYHAGPLMNVGIVALTIIALPIYFIRSRGWSRGLMATGVAVGVYALTYGLEMLGEWIGNALA